MRTKKCERFIISNIKGSSFLKWITGLACITVAGVPVWSVGIYRPVYLEVLPRDFIHRIAINTEDDGQLVVDAWQQADAIVEAIQEPQFPEHTVNVRELGARADGTHNDLPALQTAVDQCSEAGGGTVQVPAGIYWLEGPLHLKSNINLQLEEGSILRFSADLDDFLPVVYTRWEGTRLFNYSPFIYVELKGSALDVCAPSEARRFRWGA